MRTECLRLGVVGLGKMGLLHSGILNVLNDVQVVGFCEKSFIARRILKKMVKGVTIVGDIEKFSDLNLDAVYITTPIPSHFQIAKTIYSKRIARNLFIEKTLTYNYSEAKELVKLAEHYSGVNMVGYLRRFSATFRKAKELLDENSIGEPTSFKTYAYSSDFCNVEDISKVSSARGGLMRDLGSYPVDLALWYFGDLSVESVGCTSSIDRNSDEGIHFVLNSATGVKGEVDVSWIEENYRMAETGFLIVGSKGTLTVNDDRVELKLKSSSPLKWFNHDLQGGVEFWLGGPNYFTEDQYFITSVRAGTIAEPTFQTASKVDKIIEEVESRQQE